VIPATIAVLALALLVLNAISPWPGRLARVVFAKLVVLVHGFDPEHAIACIDRDVERKEALAAAEDFVDAVLEEKDAEIAKLKRFAEELLEDRAAREAVHDDIEAKAERYEGALEDLAQCQHVPISYVRNVASKVLRENRAS
jgi:hypothetical protein